MVLVRTSVSISLLTVFTAGLANWPREAAADTRVFRQGLDGYSGTVDTFLKEASPGSSYGSSQVVEWDGEDADGKNIGLLRFDDIFGSVTGRVPLGVIVTSATLTYDVVNPGDTGSANEVLVSWDESVTYNTFGGDAGVQTDEYGSLVGTAAGGLGSRSLDVTTSLEAWALDPSANKGWIFRPTGNDGVEFRSSENTSSSLRPTLTVNYNLPTGAEIMPDHIDAVVGNAHVEITVFIPPGSNDNDHVHVTLTTDNGAVAVPLGATGEPPAVTLDFLQGEPTYQITPIDIGTAGSATITTTNDAELSDDTLTVSVTVGAVTFLPTSLNVTEGTTRPIHVSISPGSNGTREVVVTLTTDNSAVAVPAGASGDHLVLPSFTEGGPAEQMVDIEIGVAGQASITTTNNGGLTDADPLPVTVTAGFRFTVSADPRDEIELWEGVLEAIKTNLGDLGAFHVSCGDIDPIPPVRASIDTWFGTDALWYPGIGNHEEETGADMTWLRDEYNNGNGGARTPLKDFTNQDGPASTIETTYSWDYGNARFIMLNEYWNGTSDTGTDGDIVPDLRIWLAGNLTANTQPVVFVFGHEPAFPFHRHVGDSLDKYGDNRDAFWSLLGDEGVQAYFCGHTHVYSKHQEPGNETWQIDVGNAGNTSSGFPDGQTFADVTVTDTEVHYDIWRNVSGSWDCEEEWTVLIGLKIRLNTSQIQHTVNQGEDLDNDTFTVRAVGAGTLNYTITADDEDPDWLGVSPDNGSSEGEEDTIQVIYTVAGLSPGTYPATITVASGDAINSPQTIDVTVTVQGPTIVLSDSVINSTVFVGDDLPKDSFTVANGGPATLNYSIQDDDNAPWLSVDPETGVSTGEEDTIELIYTVSGLPAQVDPHTATIQVFSGDADNSPQALTVNVTVETVSPDFDFDADVDLEDFGQFQVCFSGSIPQYDPACFKARLDGDLDVDGDDLAIFQACLSGAEVPAEPTCDD